jgi:hypothetical protein
LTQRGEVDWDRLADHLGGALAGTAAGAEVERLVATDPGWSRAAAELATAFDAVTADLRGLPEPSLPDDVAARLDAALGGSPPAAAAPTLLPGAGRPGRTPGPARPAPAAPAVPEQRAARPARGAAAASLRPAGRPRRTRRRRAARWGAGFALAAGVAAFAAVGITALSPSSPLSIAGSDDGGQPASVPERSTRLELPGSGSPAPVVLASGGDYQPPTVMAGQPEVPAPGAEGAPQVGPAGERDSIAQPPPELDPDQRIPDVVPPTLARLWAIPAAREQCLELVLAELDPAPVVIDVVDFARFEGEDALVIWATAADGSRLVWVSGPDCGTAAAGPDGRFQTRQ